MTSIGARDEACPGSAAGAGPGCVIPAPARERSRSGFRDSRHGRRLDPCRALPRCWWNQQGIWQGKWCSSTLPAQAKTRSMAALTVWQSVSGRLAAAWTQACWLTLTSLRTVPRAARRGCRSRDGQPPCLGHRSEHRYSREGEFLPLLTPAGAAQPPVDHAFVRTAKPNAAAAPSWRAEACNAAPSRPERLGHAVLPAGFRPQLGSRMRDLFIFGAVLVGVEQHQVAASGAFDPDGTDQIIITILTEGGILTGGGRPAREQEHRRALYAKRVRRAAHEASPQAELLKRLGDFGDETLTPSHALLYLHPTRAEARRRCQGRCGITAGST